MYDVEYDEINFGHFEAQKLHFDHLSNSEFLIFRNIWTNSIVKFF